MSSTPVENRCMGLIKRSKVVPPLPKDGSGTNGKILTRRSARVLALDDNSRGPARAFRIFASIPRLEGHHRYIRGCPGKFSLPPEFWLGRVGIEMDASPPCPSAEPSSTSEPNSFRATPRKNAFHPPLRTLPGVFGDRDYRFKAETALSGVQTPVAGGLSPCNAPQVVLRQGAKQGKHHPLLLELRRNTAPPEFPGSRRRLSVSTPKSSTRRGFGGDVISSGGSFGGGGGRGQEELVHSSSA